MKKLLYAVATVLVMGAVLQGCSAGNGAVDGVSSSGTQEVSASEGKLTEEAAYEGVSNYCHAMYDWSIAQDNPEIMYLEMGESSDTEYQVIFHSYTGALVYFYVDPATGTTNLKERVPELGIEDEAGSINLYDYLEKQI